MNILTLEQLQNEQFPVKNNRKEIRLFKNISGKNNNIFEKPIFDTESYYYFTEVWKYRPFS